MSIFGKPGHGTHTSAAGSGRVSNIVFTLGHKSNIGFGWSLAKSQFIRVVAHRILETPQVLGLFFLLGPWTRACQFVINTKFW